jgi:hypothetical protein
MEKREKYKPKKIKKNKHKLIKKRKIIMEKKKINQIDFFLKTKQK